MNATDRARLALFSQLRQDDLSDYTIKCKSRTWKVHRLVLASHSVVLKRIAVRSGGTMTLHYDEDEVEAFVEYLYSCDYQCSAEDVACFHIKMHILSSDYHIPHLNKISAEAFEKCIQNPVTLDELTEIIDFTYTVPASTTKLRKILTKRISESEGFETGSKLDEVVDEMREKFPLLVDDIERMVSTSEQIRGTEPAVSERAALSQCRLSECLSFEALLTLIQVGPEPPGSIHPDYSTVVNLYNKRPEVFVEISCTKCGANSLNGVWFDGLWGLRRHFKDIHQMDASINDPERWAAARALHNTDVRLLKRGKEPVKMAIEMREGVKEASESEWDGD